MNRKLEKTVSPSADEINNILEEELEEEKFIAEGEAFYAKTWNLACGDDF